MRIAGVFAAYAVVALAGLGLLATALGAAACDENLHPGTTRTEVCTKIGLDGPAYTLAAFLYAFGPTLVLVLLLALFPLREGTSSRPPARSPRQQLPAT